MKGKYLNFRKIKTSLLCHKILCIIMTFALLNLMIPHDLHAYASEVFNKNLQQDECVQSDDNNDANNTEHSDEIKDESVKASNDDSAYENAFVGPVLSDSNRRPHIECTVGGGSWSYLGGPLGWYKTETNTYWQYFDVGTSFDVIFSHWTEEYYPTRENKNFNGFTHFETLTEDTTVSATWAELCKVSGNVTDAHTGQTIAGATIKFLKDDYSWYDYNVSTADDGSYSIDINNHSTYNVVVEKEGYKTLTCTHTLQDQISEPLNLTLEPDTAQQYQASFSSAGGTWHGAPEGWTLKDGSYIKMYDEGTALDSIVSEWTEQFNPTRDDGYVFDKWYTNSTEETLNKDTYWTAIWKDDPTQTVKITVSAGNIDGAYFTNGCPDESAWTVTKTDKDNHPIEYQGDIQKGSTLEDLETLWEDFEPSIPGYAYFASWNVDPDPGTQGQLFEDTTLSANYEWIQMYTVTMYSCDCGHFEPSKGVPEGWTESLTYHAYSKDVPQGTSYSDIYKEWEDHQPVSNIEGANFVNWDPNDSFGTVEENTTFSAKYSKYVVNMDPISPDGIRGEFKSIPEGWEKALGSSYKKVFDADTSFEDIFKEWEGHEPVVDSTTETYVFDKWVTDDTEKVLHDNTTFNATYKQEHSGFYVDCSVAGGSWSSKGGPEGWELTSSKSYKKYFDEGTSFEDIFSEWTEGYYPTREGMSFNGFGSYFEKLTKDTYVTANWAELCQLSGNVTDNQTGSAISGATIKFMKDDYSWYNYNTTTDADGNYSIDINNHTTYNVIVEKEGYATLERQYTLYGQTSETLNLTLEPVTPQQYQASFSSAGGTWHGAPEGWTLKDGSYIKMYNEGTALDSIVSEWTEQFNPTRDDGYVFDKWYTNSTEETLNKDTYWTAIWKDDPTQTVKITVSAGNIDGAYFTNGCPDESAWTVTKKDKDNHPIEYQGDIQKGSTLEDLETLWEDFEPSIPGYANFASWNVDPDPGTQGQLFEDTTLSANYEWIQMYTVTMYSCDCGHFEPSKGVPEGWTESLTYHAYSKDVPQGTSYSDIYKEWEDHQPVSNIEGANFVNWDPNDSFGTVEENTTFSAKYSKYVVNMDPISPDGIRGEFKSIPEGWEKALGSSYKKVFDADTSFEDIFKEWEGHEPVVDSTTETYVFDKWVTDDTEKVLHDNTTFNATYKQEHSGFYVDCSVAGGSWSSKGGPEGWELTSSKSYKKYFDEGTSFEDIFSEWTEGYYPTREGMSFNGFGSYFEKLTKDTYVTANWAELCQLSGNVTDNHTGNAIAGATIKFMKDDYSWYNYNTTTDADGNYSIDINNHTTYNVVVEKEGYVTLERQYTLFGQTSETLNLTLEPVTPQQYQASFSSAGGTWHGAPEGWTLKDGSYIKMYNEGTTLDSIVSEWTEQFNPTRDDGYVFDKWYTNSTEETLNKDTYWTAIWKDDPTQTVKITVSAGNIDGAYFTNGCPDESAWTVTKTDKDNHPIEYQGDIQKGSTLEDLETLWEDFEPSIPGYANFASWNVDPDPGTQGQLFEDTTLSANYEWIQMYTVTMYSCDCGHFEPSKGVPEGWTESLTYHAYSKDVPQGTSYSDIYKEWEDHQPVSNIEGANFVNWDPNDSFGTVEENTTFSAKYSKYVVNMDPISPDGIRGEFKSIPEGWEKALGSSYKKVFDADTSFEDIFKEWEGHEPVVDSTTETYVFDKWVTDDTEKVLHDNTTFNATYKQEHSGFYVDCSVAGGSWSSKGGPEGWELTSSKSYKKYFDEGTSFEDIFSEWTEGYYPTREGMSFNGFGSYFEKLTKDTYVTANWAELCQLSGNVTDNQTGNAIAGATIKFMKDDYSWYNYNTTTDADGNYSIDINNHTTYNVIVEKEGYVTLERQYTLYGQTSETLNLTLEPVTPQQYQASFSSAGGTWHGAPEGWTLKDGSYIKMYNEGTTLDSIVSEWTEQFNPTKDGYTFDKWETNSTEQTLTKDTYWTAAWKDKPLETCNLLLDGGDGHKVFALTWQPEGGKQYTWEDKTYSEENLSVETPLNLDASGKVTAFSVDPEDLGTTTIVPVANDEYTFTNYSIAGINIEPGQYKLKDFINFASNDNNIHVTANYKYNEKPVPPTPTPTPSSADTTSSDSYLDSDSAQTGDQLPIVGIGVIALVSLAYLVYKKIKNR